MAGSILDTPVSTPIAAQTGSSNRAVIYLSTSSLDGSYASVADCKEISIPDNAGYDFSTRSLDRHLRIASRWADSLLGQRFAVPLKYWSDALVWAVCEVAYCNHTLAKRGVLADTEEGKILLARKATAEEWVRAARDYEITPDPRLDAVDEVKVPTYYSDVPRGWTERRRPVNRGW